MIAAQSVEILKAAVEGEPEDWGMRRELAEAMLEAGDRAGGIRELESAMAGAERSGNLDLASSLAEEIARLEPEVVRHHQKRVEFAFRTNDRGRLIEAYLALGDALVLADQQDRARTVYQRVLDLAPDDARARAALDTIVEPEPEPAPPPAPRASRISGIEPPRRTTPPKGVETNGAMLTPTTAGFVNLGDWLRDEQAPRDTRMVVEEQEPSGDEEADFADMLRKFKQGVAENMDPEDYQSHYDLAIAFKEMGLLDEAIAEFQKALAGPANRLPTFEALGQCFLEKNQYKMASSILSRALSERDATEDKLVGVLYLLGRAAEAMHKHDDALAYYQRVFVLDIQFRDIADRISDVERAAR
jgi:tetratricopeptide (TPR) repeat protein